MPRQLPLMDDAKKRMAEWLRVAINVSLPSTELEVELLRQARRVALWRQAFLAKDQERIAEISKEIEGGVQKMEKMIEAGRGLAQFTPEEIKILHRVIAEGGEALWERIMKIS